MNKRTSFLNSKNLHPDVKLYIRNLEKENSKLQSKIVKLGVTNISYTNKIIAMEKEIKALTKKLSESLEPKLVGYKGKYRS